MNEESILRIIKSTKFFTNIHVTIFPNTPSRNMTCIMGNNHKTAFENVEVSIVQKTPITFVCYSIFSNRSHENTMNAE